MENHARVPIIVLKIEIRPEESSKLLEKQLLKINGVHQVAVNREKKEVTIIGDVDPIKLVKYIAKVGIKAELSLYDKKPKTDQASHTENDHKSTQDSRDKHPDVGNQNARQSGVGCPDDHPYCKVKDSFHHEYRPPAKDVEEEKFRERHGQFHSSLKDNNYRAAAKEFGEEACRDQHGQFHSVHNDTDRAAPGKKAEEETFRDAYGQFHSVHNDKYCSASKGVDEEVCPDQYAQFHGRSRNAKGSVPPVNNERAKYYAFPDNHPHGNMEDSSHQDEYQAAEEMNQGRYGQYYRSTNGFVPQRNNEQDAKCCSFPDDHPHRAAGKGVEEEMSWGGYDQYQGRTRNANYGNARTRYDEDVFRNNKDHPHMKGYTYREAKIEEVIKEAKKDMDRFFIGIRRRSNDHLPRGSSACHHEMPTPSRWIREEPPADDHYQDRNPPLPAFRERRKPDFEFREEPPPVERHRERMVPPPPPPTSPPRIYRRRRGIHYDKFTNIFSDENPSSCTIT